MKKNVFIFIETYDKHRIDEAVQWFVSELRKEEKSI